jgi:hypothetical protein
MVTRFTAAENDAAVGYSSYGSPAWADPAKALAPSDGYASAAVDAETDTYWLKLTGLVDKVPAGAAIDGVEVRVTAGPAGPFGIGWLFNRVQLAIAGVVGSDDRAGDRYVSADGVYAFGGPADLFGRADLTPAVMNATGFGVGLAAAGSSEARVHDVDVVVHYH